MTDHSTATVDVTADVTADAATYGRVIVINGGTQGLGEALARRLVEPGPSTADGLVLVGRSADRGQALATELSSTATRVVFVEADAADPETPQRVATFCDDTFGTVHGLVNIAALTTRGNLWSDTVDHFDRMMATNVRGPYFLTQAITRLMIREGASGSIVNVGSVAGTGGPPRLAAYAMSKAALAVMTKNLAYTLLPYDIRVNQVNPGWMDTDNEHLIQVHEDGQPADWLTTAEAARPLGRLVKPWEVANAIAFCLSPESGLMSGAALDIEQAVLGAGDLDVPSRDAVPHPDDHPV